MMPSERRETQQMSDYIYFHTGNAINCFQVHAYVRTLHLDHINGNLLLPHAEDFEVGDDTLTGIKTRKQILAFHFYVSALFSLPVPHSPFLPVFLWEFCPLSHRGNLHFSASAACSRQHWKGCGPWSLDGRASASESLWLGCLCPQVPRMLSRCHQETMKSPCAQTQDSSKFTCSMSPL